MRKYGILGRHARAVGLVVTTLGLGLLSGTPANAALVSTSTCDGATLTQPFAPWGDSALYKLMPGGTFSSGASGWSLSGRASVVPNGVPFAVNGTISNASVNLPAGSSVQSPFTCVDAAYPSFRFFARNNGLLSTVAVSVVYPTLLGDTVLPVGTVAVSGSWTPSLPMVTGSAVTGLLSGGTTEVALRFTALTGDSQIDDVFVDPRMMH